MTTTNEISQEMKDQFRAIDPSWPEQVVDAEYITTELVEDGNKIVKEHGLERMTTPQFIDKDGTIYEAMTWRIPANDSLDYISDLIRRLKSTGYKVLFYSYLTNGYGNIEVIRKIRLGLPREFSTLKTVVNRAVGSVIAKEIIGE